MFPRWLSSLGIILCLCSVGRTEELKTDPTEVLHDENKFLDKPNLSEQINEIHQELIPDLRFKIKREINDDDENDSLENEFTTEQPSSEEGDNEPSSEEGDDEPSAEEDNDGIAKVGDNESIEEVNDSDDIKNEEDNDGIDENSNKNVSEEDNSEESSPFVTKYDSFNTTEKNSNETESEENSYDSSDYAQHSPDLNIIPALRQEANDSSENVDSEIPKQKVNSPKSIIHRNKNNQEVDEDSSGTNINDQKYDTMADTDTYSDTVTDNSSDIVRVDRYTFPHGDHEDRSSGSSGAVVIFLFFLMSIGFLTFLGIYYKKLSFSNSRYGFHSPLPMREMEEDEMALFDRENRYSSWDAVPMV